MKELPNNDEHVFGGRREASELIVSHIGYIPVLGKQFGAHIFSVNSITWFINQ